MTKVKVRKMQRAPRDLAKFVPPTQAAKMLRAMANALDSADQNTTVHIHMKVRVAKREREKP